VVFGPAGLWLAVSHPVPQAAWGVLVLTSVFETAYFWLLGSAYRAGDLSLAYPVARAVSPILEAAAAGQGLVAGYDLAN
jgi:hypothetical protein